MRSIAGTASGNQISASGSSTDNIYDSDHRAGDLRQKRACSSRFNDNRPRPSVATLTSVSSSFLIQVRFRLREKSKRPNSSSEDSIGQGRPRGMKLAPLRGPALEGLGAKGGDCSENLLDSAAGRSAGTSVRSRALRQEIKASAPYKSAEFRWV
jgi:hypothetical protein